MEILSPLSLIAATEHDVHLFAKRDDLLEPEIQGNKWRKLHLLLQSERFGQERGITTFGGPFSNHLYAVAAAGKRFGFPTVGIIRGVYDDPSNPTLAYTRACGMQLRFVSKKVYDEGLMTAQIQEIIHSFPNNYVLPEGGSTVMGVHGCVTIGREILAQIPNKNELVVCVPAGTGCTAAGLIAGLAGQGRVLVFPATTVNLDRARVHTHLREAGYPPYDNFEIISDYTFGGFAQLSDELLLFVQQFYTQYQIMPDPIYTAKMFYGIFDLLEREYFSPGAQIVALHTGGLQGWNGFRHRFGDKAFIVP
ncbi:MAG: pyridoxal-phosphate dependent enzyme [Bacteroidota bacterium]